MPTPHPIESAIQLLVEGHDECYFFDVFIKYLSLENIQIQNFAGVTQLRGFLEGLPGATGFDKVESIGVVRDAEDSAENAFRSVQSSLKNAGLPVPAFPEDRTKGCRPVVTALILPGDNRKGMLETLLCESFADMPVNQCINQFFECVRPLPDRSIKNPDKARAFAYLITKPDPPHSVGVAAKREHWNLDSPVFAKVRDFLKGIAALPAAGKQTAAGRVENDEG